MLANPTRRFVRLAALAALALLLQGSECDKESDFFALDGEDGTVTPPDLTPPVIDNFQPSGDGVFAVDNFMFEVIDPGPDGIIGTGDDGGPVDVSVTNDAIFPVTLDGSMATVDLSGTPDGMHTFDIQASDMAGNTAMSTFSLNLDWTAPVVDFTSAPPSSAETDDETFEFFAAFSVSDPNFLQGTYTFREPGSNGTCDPDDSLWPEGSDPGEVDQNTFSVSQPGSFEIRGTFNNPLGQDDSPLTQTICGRYEATDTALGKTGQPNPNTFDQVFGLDITWGPPTPTTGIVTGTVTRDDAPFSGVSIQLDGMSMTTNDQGVYMFTGVTPGMFQVQPVNLPSDVFCDPAFRNVDVVAGQTAQADFTCVTVQSGPPPTGQLFGVYAFGLTRTATTGSCTPPISGNSNTMVSGDESTNTVTVQNLDPVADPLTGPYDPNTGNYSGMGNGVVNGVDVFSDLDGEFMFDGSGGIEFNGTLFRDHQVSGSTICTETYQASGQFQGTSAGSY